MACRKAEWQDPSLPCLKSARLRLIVRSCIIDGEQQMLGLRVLTLRRACRSARVWSLILVSLGHRQPACHLHSPGWHAERVLRLHQALQWHWPPHAQVPMQCCGTRQTARASQKRARAKQLSNCRRTSSTAHQCARAPAPPLCMAPGARSDPGSHWQFEFQSVARSVGADKHGGLLINRTASPSTRMAISGWQWQKAAGWPASHEQVRSRLDAYALCQTCTQHSSKLLPVKL